MADIKRRTKEEIKRLVDEILHDAELTRGLPIDEWSVSGWEWMARFYLTMFVEEWDKHEETVDFVRAMVKILERSALNDNRVKGRNDQVDKRAFQEAVRTNIEEYATKAAAIRDLRVKPQFENYPDNTLREWLKREWNKPTKRGAPKKLKKSK